MSGNATRTADRLARVRAIRETAVRVDREKAEHAATVKRRRDLQHTRSGNAKYYAKLKVERETIAKTGGAPYDRVVKRIERLTGIPASRWERDSRHPYTKRAVEAAQYLAGVVQMDQSRKRAA